MPRRDKTEIEVMTPSEAFTFTELCRTMPNGLIFEFALETGMRPEEYLALRWKDINDDQVAVQQAVQFNRKGGGYYFKDLKTQQSRRLVPITDELRRSLHRHRIEQNVHRLAMKGTWFDHDLVFANEIGRPYAINNLTRRYLAPILDKCDFDKHIKLYSLRHTCATLLMLGGTNAKIVATRLGHASVTMTLETYSHVLPSMQADATELMNTMMRKKAV